MKLYTDGASRGNPGKSGGGIFLIGEGKIEEHSIYFGIRTNNEAEYLALIEGLKLAINRGVTELEIFMDSQLAVKQLQGEYKVKNAGIRPLFKEARNLLSKLKWKLHHIERSKNKIADKLANKAINLEE